MCGTRAGAYTDETVSLDAEMIAVSNVQPVSRETQARLDRLATLVRKWNPAINLVAPSTLSDLEQRHIRDSLQLSALAPGARRWLDLGSGGGFPGLVIASVVADIADAQVVLVESNGKKCAFLREAVRQLQLPVRVVQARIENSLPELAREAWDVVSARALASLDTLLSMAAPVLLQGVPGLFPKGRDVDDEVAQARGSWNFTADLIQSQTDDAARLVRITELKRRA